MSWLSLLTAAVRLFTSLTDLLRERALIAAGEARGRAASDADHTRAAAEADAAMRDIADRPPSRADIDKRLERGDA